MNPLPKIHVALVEIPDAKDPESIALAAVHAGLELLLKVSADERSAVVIDRVAIVKPTNTGSRRGVALDFADLLGVDVSSRGSAVMVTCRVQPPKPAETEEGK